MYAGNVRFFLHRRKEAVVVIVGFIETDTLAYSVYDSNVVLLLLLTQNIVII